MIHKDLRVINQPPSLLTCPCTGQNFEIDLGPTAPQDPRSWQREGLGTERHIDPLEDIDGARWACAEVMVAHEFARSTEATNVFAQRMSLSWYKVSSANATYRRVLEVLDDSVKPVGAWAGVIVRERDEWCRGAGHTGAHRGDNAGIGDVDNDQG
jgi:hypothetical protein